MMGLLFVLLPILLVFKSLVLGGLVTLGDAPFFYPEGLINLIGEPLAWVQRGNAFGGINNLIWLSPLMNLFGLIGSSDLAVRVLFYFPGIILAILSSYKFAKYLGLSRVGSLFTTLIYLLNTYFILLVDGGQVGVVLAYGIFPFALLGVRKFSESPKVKTFYSALLISLGLTVVDPRIALICFVTALVWTTIDGQFKKISFLIPLSMALIGMNMFWIYPLLANGDGQIGLSTGATSLKWYHPVSLFSPNWPENLFGKVSPYLKYFLGVPILISLGVVLKRSKKQLTYLLVFITFCILSLGVIPFSKLPFGFIFRDTTKFFIPIILFAGVLIGSSVEKTKNKLFTVLVYTYLLFLIHPALTGKLNFVLSGIQERTEYNLIYEHLKSQVETFRTVWLPEAHPLAFQTERVPAVNAMDLVQFFPFAKDNLSEDPYNFLNKSDYVEWLRVLGVKYLVMGDSARQITKTTAEEDDWKEINALVSSEEDLKRVELGGSIPVYEISDTRPKFTAVDSLTAVVGAPLPGVNPFTVYFEDGRLDPTLLEGKDSSSVLLYFNNSSEVDLAMSFLSKHFVSVRSATQNQWATYGPGEYLKYRYELLIRGVSFNDFDYAKGIAFSTIKGEKLKFEFDVAEAGDYTLVVRSMTPSMGETNLVWKSYPLTLPKGKYKREIVNESDMVIVNVVGLIPKAEMDAALTKAEVFQKHFKVIGKSELPDNDTYQEESVTKFGNLGYKLVSTGKTRWIIMSDNYHPLWKLKRGNQYFDSVPVFSMVNGFYVKGDWTDLAIEFRGQTNVRWGIYWSVATLIILSIIYLWTRPKRTNKSE